MADNSVTYNPFRSGELERTAPSTEPQREIISSALLGDTANIAFNEGISIHFPFVVDEQQLADALAVIVGRHESLRSTFTRTGDELCVSAEIAPVLTVDDQSAVPAVDAEKHLRWVWEDLARTPMNLFDGPLFQARLIRLPGDASELVIMAHHIICDGWSFYILIEELMALLNDEELTAKPDSFADFAERQDAEQASNADIDFWLHEFETSVPELDLPTNRPRPAERSFSAKRTDFVLDGEALESIQSLARQCKASIVQVVFSALTALVHRLTNDEDIAIGLPVARQSASGLHYLLGHAVQLLPIHLSVTPDQSFNELVARAKSKILDAQEHPNFTFGSLVRELHYSGDPARVPIAPIIFNIDQPFGKMSVRGRTVTVRSIPRFAENFEIFFNIMPSPDSLGIEATFNTDLFDEQTIQDWMSALRLILETAAETPNVEIRHLWQNTGAANAQARVQGDELEVAPTAWIERVIANIKASADEPAVVDRSETVTYAELGKRVAGVVAFLRDHGIAQGDVVAHCMSRSANLLPVMLGIQSVGATMLPLDPEFPEERLSFMISDSGAKMILSDRVIPESVAGDDVAVASVSDAIANSAAELSLDIGRDTAAYLIYTSGSTGRPKGVLVPHSALSNFLAAMATEPGCQPQDRLLAVTTTSFDISCLELLLPLYCGASVYVASKSESTDSLALQSLLDSAGISIMQATPATWRLLIAGRWSGKSDLKCLCGGEPLPPVLASRLLPLVGELWNMYGPTETTIWSSCKRISPDFETITIGRPILNTSFLVLDESRNAVPSGIPGELCIAGAGLAIGYLGRPELTSDRFIDSPSHGRLYRTGDKARILADGEVQFLGRFDDQVKVRGFRIELGDIEAAIQAFPTIEAAAVHIWQVSADDQRIVACCVLVDGEQLAVHRLRKFLRSKLPDYMVPQHFLEIDALPLSPSGKVNRKALPKPVEVKSKIGNHSPPKNAAEKAIAGIWELLVKPQRPVGREDKFFEIGGHSLLGLEAIFSIEKRLNVRLNPRVLYTQSLAEIAALCEGGESQQAASRPAKRQADDEPALSFGQLDIIQTLNGGTVDASYNLPACFKLIGKLDLARFEESLRSVFDRYDALTTVLSKDGGDPGPAPSSERSIPQLKVINGFNGGDDDAIEYVTQMSEESTDLASGPLVKLGLLSSASGANYFCFIPHQFCFDGWSFDVFLKSLESAYTHGGKLPAKADDDIDYADFAIWQRNQKVDPESLAYWRAQSEILRPSPDWSPVDADPGKAVGAFGFSMALPTVEKLESFSQHHGAKLSDLCLAVLVDSLAASSAQASISLDVATSGRYLPELFSIIGLFFQELPVSIDAGDNVTETLVNTDRAIRSLAQNQANARAQIESQLDIELVQPSVSFSYQQATERPTSFGGLGFEQVDVPRSAIFHDLDFWIRRTPSGLVAQLDFRPDGVRSDAVEALCKQIEQVLTKIARNDLSGGGSGVEDLFSVGQREKKSLLSKIFS